MTEENDIARALHHALYETLDTLVSPTVRDAVISDALRKGGLARVPTNPEAAHRFVMGPLRAVASRSLGPEMADTIADEIAILFARTRHSWVPRRSSAPAPDSGRSTGVRPRGTSSGSLDAVEAPGSSPPGSEGTASTKQRQTLMPDSREVAPATSRPPGSYIRGPGQTKHGDPRVATPSEYFRKVVEGTPAPTSKPGAAAKVLVATRDAELLEQLDSWIYGRARVQLVESVLALLHEVEDAEGPLVIVLDARYPTIRPTALAALTEELGGARILLCRGTAQTTRAAFRVSPSVTEWTTVADPTPVERVAEQCLKLVC